MRDRPKGMRRASIGLGICIFALTPSDIGRQNMTSLLAREPGAAGRWQPRIFSATPSIEVASMSVARPIGTFDPESAAFGRVSLNNEGLSGRMARPQGPRDLASDFPVINRARKAGRLPLPPSPPFMAQGRPPRPAAARAATSGAARRAALDPRLQEP